MDRLVDPIWEMDSIVGSLHDLKKNGCLREEAGEKGSESAGGMILSHVPSPLGGRRGFVDECVSRQN